MQRPLWLILASGAWLLGQTPDSSFFEAKIRPVLATQCYSCHAAKMKAPMGGLVLDTKAGLAAGGVNGPVVAPGKPAASRLLTALRYTDTHLQMPPSGKLSAAVIADFETWIAAGAADPRTSSGPAGASTALRGMSVEDGRKWWAFQPLSPVDPPRIRNAAWPRKPLDAFVLAKLEAGGYTPSLQADRRTLVRRAYLDLVGFKPTYEEVEAFAADSSAEAWPALIDKLQALPQYGERCGRHWMDVARYGEENATAEAPNQPLSLQQHSHCRRIYPCRIMLHAPL